ncbi:MAG: ATP-binding protein [SAR324 cluster bacterium]|nr:ATP-binding protein [SAR324 cluster bacterium]
MNSKVDRPENFDESVSHIPIETWFQLLQMGSWKLNLRNKKLICSLETLDLLGFPKSHQITLDVWLGLVHSDDLQRFKQFMKPEEGSSKRELDFQIHHPKKSIIWLRAVAELSFDLEAKPFEFLGVVSDITAQKEKVLKATDSLREELTHAHKAIKSSNRLATIGEASASLAHELKTPLSVLMTQLHNLNIQRQLNRLGEKELDEHILSMTTVTEGLLNRLRLMQEMTHVGKTGLGPCCVGEVLKGVKSLIGPTLEDRGFKMMVDLPKQLPLIRTNRSQLEQVLLILCNNAVDALKHAPKPSLVLIFSMEEQFAKIEVIDNGLGMNETTISNIFSPFFTTKKRGQGTGLGLSIAKKIIEEHNGQISVKSSLGLGTTFTIRLRLAEKISRKVAC